MQYNILVNALRYVKQGGKVLYSTCTVNRDENEKLVRRVLSDMPGFEIKRELQLFQTEGGPDGFYICILESK